MYQGDIISKDKGYITGWIKNSGQSSPVKIQVLCRDKILRKIYAKRKLKNDPSDSIGKHGFRFSIADLIKDGAKESITIKTEDGGFKFNTIDISQINIHNKRKMNLEKRQVNKVNVILVGGEPNSGKTTFANNFKKLYKGVYVLSLDKIFEDDMYPEKAESKLMGFVNSSMFNREDFIKLFLNEYLQKIPFNSINTLIVEGWLLSKEWIKNKLVQVLSVYGITIYAETVEHKLKFRGKIYDGSHEENAKAFYGLYQKNRLANLTERTTYQFYEDLGQKAKNSNSAEKIKKAAIPNLKGKVVLDIGCNAGYMSNNFARAGAKHVYGIDVRRVSVNVASQYNNVFYQSPNVSFHHIDVFDFHPKQKLDIVYASSVFHYFRNRQDLFFEHMYKNMSSSGKMIIEIELYEEKQEEAFTYKYKRSVDDTPCHFPNQKMMDKMIKSKFEIESKVLSVNQKGSKLNRYFFHLKRLK